MSPSFVSAQTGFFHPEGFAEPWKTVRVASPEAGVLDKLFVKEGEKVSQGEKIATLDSLVLEASRNAAQEQIGAKGRINGVQATLKNKSYHLKQMELLLKQEHASDKEVRQAQLEVDLATANLEQAQDEVRSLEMDLKKIEAQLERRIVRAPVSGTVLEVHRQVGEAVSSAESQVATIVVLDQLRVRYFLPTKYATSLKINQSLIVTFPDTDQTANATVSFVSPVTDSKSGTVRVELLIPNKDGRYRSGLRCVLNAIRMAKHELPRLPIR